MNIQGHSTHSYRNIVQKSATSISQRLQDEREQSGARFLLESDFFRGVSHLQNKTVLVASVSVVRNGSLLMVRENKSSAKDLWNFPSGHVEFGEDILAAACRECKEETGLDVKLTNTTGIYNFESNTRDQVILFHFTAEVVGGIQNVGLYPDISETTWMKLSELVAIDDTELRESRVIRKITHNLINNHLYPLTLFNQTLKQTSS
ncbi:NUDIX domain-containing protein [Alicyclobacillus sp. ALC3]|nr:NUDIX domain-containing protein [Alicyclobacillus sp. ALC3]